MRAAHDLAAKLGIVNVRKMMRSLTWREWLDWLTYMNAAPFSEERADMRAASICQTFVNINRDTKKHPQPFPLSDFVLEFGDVADAKKAKPKQQTAAEIERHLLDWFAGSNKVIEEEKKSAARR